MSLTLTLLLSEELTQKKSNHTNEKQRIRAKCHIKTADPCICQEEEEIPNFENIVEKIKNVFTLILLTSRDDLSIDTIFTEYDYTPENIKRIKECTDSDILYYCYLVVTQRKEHKINDKVII
jgi:hypothetical protein